MTLQDTNGFITVRLSDGTIAATVTDSSNWNDTISSMIFIDTDQSQWQWDRGSQSFLALP